MKQCTKCKEGKNESEFNKDKNRKDGLQPQCRECSKKNGREHHGNHREKQNQKSSEYYGNHREEKNQKSREYNEDHKEELSQKSKKRGNSPLPYNSKLRQELEKYEEVRESENRNTECRCAYEGQGFEPTRYQIQERLDAINGKGTEGTENKLYCSEACKQSCPTYHKIGYERGYEPASSREVQPVLRKMRFAKDNWTCQKCGRTRIILLELGLTLHCHHKEGIQGDPIESADIDACITYCEECHREFHSYLGYTYKDYQCPPHLKYNTG